MSFKNIYGSTMTEERMNELAMLYVHRDIKCNPDKVAEEFESKWNDNGVNLSTN